MQTEKCLILGLGKSAQQAPALGRFFTIGVNDVSRFHHTPDLLVILDRIRRFTPERIKWIEMTQAKEAWVSYPDDWTRHLPDVGAVKKLKATRYNPTGLFFHDQVYHYRTSPFAAMSLAVVLGFKEIGILGVDMLDDHHMSRLAKDINEKFNLFAQDAFLRNRIRIVNCSPKSRLTLPYVDLEEF